jgi:hypothetical protein
MTVANDICERIIAYWENPDTRGELLPEINTLTKGQFEEVMDGLPLDCLGFKLHQALLNRFIMLDDA